MKRADLQTGSDYLLNASPDWMEQTYRSRRVRLVSNGRWEDGSRNSWIPSRVKVVALGGGSTPRLVATSGRSHDRAQGVLVVNVQEDGTLQTITVDGIEYPHAYVTTLGSLRGEWGPMRAQQQDAQRKAAAYRAERQAAHDAAIAKRDARVAEVAQMLGRDLQRYTDWTDQTGRLMFSDAILSELLGGR